MSKFTRRSSFVLACVALLSACNRNVVPLPVLWTMPAWRLTDQDQRPLGGQELRGKVYIANFIFTSCTMSCPRLTARMANLQTRFAPLGGTVRLVSITVDPEHDSPAQLRAYGVRHGADFRTWSFVTGPTTDVLRAIEQGFKVGLQRPDPNPDGTFNPIALAHSNRFALVDKQGRLRGSYEATDEGMTAIVRDATALLTEEP